MGEGGGQRDGRLMPLPRPDGLDQMASTAPVEAIWHERMQPKPEKAEDTPQDRTPQDRTPVREARTRKAGHGRPGHGRPGHTRTGHTRTAPAPIISMIWSLIEIHAGGNIRMGQREGPGEDLALTVGATDGELISRRGEHSSCELASWGMIFRAALCRSQTGDHPRVSGTEQASTVPSPEFAGTG